eukprot:1019783-Amphidinium_carterae.1
MEVVAAHAETECLSVADWKFSEALLIALMPSILTSLLSLIIVVLLDEWHVFTELKPEENHPPTSRRNQTRLEPCIVKLDGLLKLIHKKPSKKSYGILLKKTEQANSACCIQATRDLSRCDCWLSHRHRRPPRTQSTY